MLARLLSKLLNVQGHLVNLINFELPSSAPQPTRVLDKQNQRAEVSVDSHLTELSHLRDEAKDSGQIAAAISAEVSRGKVAGLYIDRKEVMVSKMETMSSEDLISRIKQIVDGSNIKTINHEDGESIIPSIENQPAESSLAKD